MSSIIISTSFIFILCIYTILTYATLIVSFSPEYENVLLDEDITEIDNLTNEVNTKLPVLTTPDSVTVEDNSSPIIQSTHQPASPSPSPLPDTETGSERPSTTIIPSPSPSPSPSPKPTHNVLCLCDLHMNACDINCCCDPDCSQEKKLVFVNCKGSEIYDSASPNQREQSCYRSYIFYYQNTPYRLERSKDGLFCIVTDNYKQETSIQFSKEELNRSMNESRTKYGWWTTREKKELKFQNIAYKYGSIIWGIIWNKQSKTPQKQIPFTLPSSYQGYKCSVNVPLKFLHDTSASCLTKITNLKEECESLKKLSFTTYINNNVSIIGDPRESILDEIEIRTAICFINSSTNIFGCKEESIISDSSFDDSENLCKNVLHSLNVTVIHEGVEGIIDVIAKAELKDFPFDTKDIQQHFRVNFVWISNTTNTNTTDDELDINITKWPRSGNPGYIVGKPVIMGEVVDTSIKTGGSHSTHNSNSTQSGEGNKESEQIAMSKDPSRWMTVLSPGECDLNLNASRRSVLFGLDHMSTCSIKASNFKNCSDLQMEIRRLLTGSENPTEKKDNKKKYIAAFGNPDTISEWTEILVDDSTINSKPMNSECNIVSFLKIRIGFAYVGSVHFPQAKILAVQYKFGESYSVPSEVLCKDNCQTGKDIIVTTTVTFVDITDAPISKFPMWPVISIKLPSDFFYPFSSSSFGYMIHCSPLKIIILAGISYFHEITIL